MPRQLRWNINSEDSAAIFGAIHIGLVPTTESAVELIPVITDWLCSHPFLEEKYGGSDFRNNFGRNFRNVIERYQRWKCDPSGGGREPSRFLSLANISHSARHEGRVHGMTNSPANYHRADEDNLSPLGVAADDDDNDVAQDLTYLPLAISSYSTRRRMVIHHFAGPNFVNQHSANDDDFLLAQKSVTVMIIMESGVDVSTRSHALVVTPGRNAKITITVNQHQVCWLLRPNP